MVIKWPRDSSLPLVREQPPEEPFTTRLLNATPSAPKRLTNTLNGPETSSLPRRFTELTPQPCPFPFPPPTYLFVFLTFFRG